MYFLGRLFELGPRFLVIILGISYLPPWYAWVIGGCVHYMLSFVLVITAKPELRAVCGGSQSRMGFMALFSFVFMFCYVHLEAGKTFKRALVYYIVFYVQNFVIMALVLQLWTRIHTNTWSYLVLTVPPGFVFHLIIVLLYYKCLHPDVEGSYLKKYRCCKY